MACLGLYALLSEDIDEPVQIEDITPDNFQRLLDFIYTDDCHIPDSADIYELSRAAHKYRLSLLLDKCIRKMICNLDVNNAFKAYEIAKHLNNQSDLYEKSVEVSYSATSWSIWQ